MNEGEERRSQAFDAADHQLYWAEESVKRESRQEAEVERFKRFSDS